MAITVMPKIAVEREYDVRYVFLAALQVLDVATTWYILSKYTQSAEGNPLVRSVIETVGIERGLIVVLLFKLMTVGLFYYCQTGVKLASAIYSLVIVNNILVLCLILFG